MLVLWGSNARETHPVMFHHMLRAIRAGARLVVIDPRRTPTVQFAHEHLQVQVGSDIALANAMAHVILEDGLTHEAFVAHATSGLPALRAHLAGYPPERAAAICGVDVEAIRRVARLYARAGRAILCWTLGITEHHNATDAVYALCNLANLTGHVGRRGSGLDPLRGQNNVQGGGDMGALPGRLPGGGSVEDPVARAPFEAEWGCALPSRAGLHQSLMFEAMGRGEIRAAYVIGENPLVSEANAGRTRAVLGALDLLVVQDIVLTQTAETADVFLPSAAAWCECDGTVTNSERRVQLVRKALEPPGQARDDTFIVTDLARAMGHPWPYRRAEDVWEEVRRLSARHRGMSYARLAAADGLQWPCPSEDHPGTPFLHADLWAGVRGGPAGTPDAAAGPPAPGRRVPLIPVDWEPPVERPDAEYPLLLTTGRRLPFFNTGVQTRGYATAVPQEEALHLWPGDAAHLGIQEGERVRVRSRRAALVVPATLDDTLAPGLCFMTLHHPEVAQTNLLTLDAWDPKSGTAEFKATAIAVERVGP